MQEAARPNLRAHLHHRDAGSDDPWWSVYHPSDTTLTWSTLVDLLSAQARLRPTLARSFSRSLGPSGDRGCFSIFRVPEFTRNPFCSGAMHGNAALRPQLSSSFCRGCVAGRRGDERATRSTAPPNAISSAWKQRMPGSAECALIGGSHLCTSAPARVLSVCKESPQGSRFFY